MKTAKEKAIDNINIKEIKANYRTAIAIIIPTMLIIGLIGGYFLTLNLTNQARSDWISAQNAIVSKEQ